MKQPGFHGVLRAGDYIGNFTIIVSATSHSKTVSPDTEWVVVLENPLPKRLQGWQRDEYSNVGRYPSSLELKRAGRRLAKRHNLAVSAEWFIESLNVYCLITSFKQDYDKTISALSTEKKVKWVQASNSFEPTKTVKPNQVTADLFNPPELRLPNWVNGQDVIVALIDSAVDTQHPDIKPSVIENVDFVELNSKQTKAEAHGTAIASIIVADHESDLGVTGLASAAKLRAYRACWEPKYGANKDKTSCTTLTLARALDAVARSESHILNLSLSGPNDRLLNQLILRIIANGTKVVTSFGPDRSTRDRFPLNSSVVVKANTLKPSRKARQLSDQALSAPGTKVVASPNNRADLMHGHSVAAAYVTGTLALCTQIETQLEKQICSPSVLKKLQESHSSSLENLIALIETELK